VVVQEADRQSSAETLARAKAPPGEFESHLGSVVGYPLVGVTGQPDQANDLSGAMPCSGCGRPQRRNSRADHRRGCFSDFDGFAREFSRLLDGFGTPDNGWVLRWLNAELSRSALGYEATAAVARPADPASATGRCSRTTGPTRVVPVVPCSVRMNWTSKLAG
jgi:hypothetical protein